MPEQRLTPDDLAAIRARVEAATPGPWEVLGPYPNVHVGRCYEDDDGEELEFLICQMETKAPKSGCLDHADAALIAHAPTDLRALLAHVTAVEDENADLRVRVEVEREADSISRGKAMFQHERANRLEAEVAAVRGELQRLREAAEAVVYVVDAPASVLRGAALTLRHLLALPADAAPSCPNPDCSGGQVLRGHGPDDYYADACPVCAEEAAREGRLRKQLPADAAPEVTP